MNATMVTTVIYCPVNGALVQLVDSINAWLWECVKKVNIFLFFIFIF